jgi:hypothetical protein
MILGLRPRIRHPEPNPCHPGLDSGSLEITAILERSQLSLG